MNKIAIVTIIAIIFFAMNCSMHKDNTTKNVVSSSVQIDSFFSVDSLTQKARLAVIGSNITVTGIAENTKESAIVMTAYDIYYLADLPSWGNYRTNKVIVSGILDIVKIKGIGNDEDSIIKIIPQGYAEDFDMKVIRNVKCKIEIDGVLYNLNLESK
jgi:hypothetical protein